MARHVRLGALALLAAVPWGIACAQTPAPAPEALSLARELLARTTPDRASTIQGLSGPMVGLMQQIGVRQPDRAQALVQEAVLPLLDKHFDEFLEIQAKSYASLLSVADMTAALAFYATPAGQDLIHAQPKLAQLQLTGVTQWIAGLQPELQAKVQQMVTEHGWDKG